MVKYSIEKSLEINAPASRIWSHLIDVKSYPEWKPFIKAISFSGERLEMGSRFKMNIAVKGPDVPVSVMVCEFEQPKRIAWTGGIPGVVISVHGFTLEDKGEKTLVTSYENFTGALVWLMRKIVTHKDLENLHDNWLMAISRRVEDKDIRT